jgi:hypothetical protein
MNIAKLILLACPVFLASILLVANPANASSLKSTPEFAIPTLTQASNPILDQLGCNCANCVQAKFQTLQGKLPSVNF